MRSLASLALLVGAATLLAGCNPVVDDDRSAVSMVATGFFTGVGGATARSGVYWDVVSDSGVASDETIWIELQSIPKNSNTTASQYYTIRVHTYNVFFTRDDGKNEPGVDVPFPQTYPIQGTLTPGGTTKFELLAVTQRMKLDPPLRSLWFSTNQRLTTRMTVTVYGRDLVENDVTASLSLLVVFADFPG